LLAVVSAEANLFLKEETDAPAVDPLDKNEQPVIAIMTQPLGDYMIADDRFKGKTSYVMADYVKYIEAQGARVVPMKVTYT
jgi:hypothetical protein